MMVSILTLSSIPSSLRIESLNTFRLPEARSEFDADIAIL